MCDGLRTIRVVTTDESLLSNVRAAASSLDGWEVAHAASVDELLTSTPALGDVVLLDGWLRSGNVYENCRRLTGITRCRTHVVVEHDNRLAEPIARFCGATGVLNRPLSATRLREALAPTSTPPPALPREHRGALEETTVFPQKLLTDLAGEPAASLVSSLTDPDSGLFNFAFLQFKLDEEFKRARRFGDPLACVMLGFEGQLDERVLRELAGIFLEASRDTDVLGRFDESSFLFLLPNTGPDGATVMARRVGDLAQKRGLVDLVGDPLSISVGIANAPAPDVKRREDLFSKARKAFLSAREVGGGVVAAG
jgi:diguanylate cyclase (GGDEF)-like protein